MSYSKEEASALETELLRDYKFGQQQLIEIWGQACAVAITKVCVFPSLGLSLLPRPVFISASPFPTSFYEATALRSPSGEAVGSDPFFFF